MAKSQRKPPTKRIRNIVVTDPSLSIQQFCDAEGLSRGLYYKLKKQGRTPRELRIDAVIRITHQARIEWRRKMQKESEAA
jgi:predicted DNA-binding transcriptional regulator AlpA